MDKTQIEVVPSQPEDAPSPTDLLQHLVSQKRTKRIETFLTTCDGRDKHPWSFPMEKHFFDALDIKLTPRITKGVQELIWTQGSRFDFREGYIIYGEMNEIVPDSLLNYKLSTYVALQVQTASPAIPATIEPRTWEKRPERVVIKEHIARYGQNYIAHWEKTKKNGEYTIWVQARRFAGYLEILKYRSNISFSEFEPLDRFPISQDDFIYLLITGVDPVMLKHQHAQEGELHGLRRRP